MKLCNVCSSANESLFASATGSDCYICNGEAPKTEHMVDSVAELLKSEDAKTFSISSLIPKEWLAREELVWDLHHGNKTQSIKNHLNHRIARELAKKSGLTYVPDGDCRAVFDYSTTQVKLQRNELFVFGRYKKFAAGLSQSRWLCASCQGKGCPDCSGKGTNYESVEEKIGTPFKKECGADDYVLHASGREDVDARNTAGRAFVLEIKNPAKRQIDLVRLASEIASGKEVAVEDLKIVYRKDVELITESHFDKSYEAAVEFGKEIDKFALESVAAQIKGKLIAQRTPSRVAHRRANLVRKRKVKELRIVNSSKNTANLLIKAEAGTYIKELISGDGGRTAPSIAELLGTSARCTGLTVCEIDDSFIDFILCGKSEKS